MANFAPTEDSMAAAPPIGATSLRHTHRFLVAFYTLAAVWGARNIRFAKASALDLLVPVALTITLGWWAVVDAGRRGHNIPVLVRPWFFLLAALVVPGYVVWSRRWKGIAWVVLHAAL